MQRCNPLYRRQLAGRGFTLVELLTVVIIIGVSAALAMPAILDQMHQRNLRESAARVASIYSDARMRALARGAAVLVRYDSTSGFSVVESIDGAAVAAARNSPACVDEPGLGCLTNNWTPGVGTSRAVGAGYTPQSELAVTVAGPLGNSVSALNVCFTPMGRSFVSTAVGVPPTTPLAGTPVFTFQRTGKWAGGYRYLVAVLPNGIARLTRGTL